MTEPVGGMIGQGISCAQMSTISIEIIQYEERVMGWTAVPKVAMTAPRERFSSRRDGR